MLDFLAMPTKRKPASPRTAVTKPRAARLDSWRNVLTGLGTSNDKGTYAEVVPTVLTQQQCEDLWRGDDMADMIVTALPSEALQAKPTLTIASIEDAEIRAAAVDVVMTALSDLKVKQSLLKALEYERAYGGAAIYVGAVDGATDAATPLRMSSIRAIRHLTVFERRQLIPVQWQEDPMEPDYGKPWLYEVQAFSGVGTGQKVHASRLVIFRGRRVTDRNPTENDGWGDSVLSLAWDALRIFNQAFAGVGYTMLDFSVAILKIKNLASIIAANSPEVVANRMQAIELGRSIAKMIPIDSEEEYERKTTTLTGVPDVLTQFSTRLAAAARMPISKLFGQSASGLNATGEGDSRNWYDAVAAYQEDHVRPPYEQLLRLIFASKSGPTKGIEPENWSLKFPSLWQPTEKERAETRKIVAETDQIYFDLGAASSEEIRTSRFGGEEYSAETEIDDTPDLAQTAVLASQAGQEAKDPSGAATTT